jgi:hypothetical protein
VSAGPGCGQGNGHWRQIELAAQPLPPLGAPWEGLLINDVQQFGVGRGKVMALGCTVVWVSAVCGKAAAIVPMSNRPFAVGGSTPCCVADRLLSSILP